MKIVYLVENVSKIEKVVNHSGRSLTNDDVCSEKTDAEIAVKNTGFREIVGA